MLQWKLGTSAIMLRQKLGSPIVCTTTGAQQNLQHHNTPAGVPCTENKIVPPNNPEVTDDNTEGTPSLSVHASYLWFKVKMTSMPHLKVVAIKILQMNLQWKKTKFIGKIA